MNVETFNSIVKQYRGRTYELNAAKSTPAVVFNGLINTDWKIKIKYYGKLDLYSDVEGRIEVYMVGNRYGSAWLKPRDINTLVIEQDNIYINFNYNGFEYNITGTRIKK